ncbi:hypothetical protein Scep_023279 [Stephania cephalantha]|uniref:Glucose-6-phosphate 1-epimerase n=1 Tax=Stephania cephalantha TaxID=152367 RepID=A0AAP0F3D9_9MAGN
MATSERVPVELCKGVNGLDKVVLREVRGGSAEIYLYGAHVTSWKNEHGDELLFVSAKTFTLRKFKMQFSNQGSLEQHGFARTKFWSIDTDPPPFPTSTSNKALIDLILKPTEEDMKIWPHSEVRVEGLETIDYLDNLQNKERFTEQGDAITFESESIGSVSSVRGGGKGVEGQEKWSGAGYYKRVPEPRGGGCTPCPPSSSATVVWNPWDKKSKAMADFGDDEYKHMLCVESAAVENPITLRPGEEWKGRQELSAVPSSYCSGQLDPQRLETTSFAKRSSSIEDSIE